MSDFNTPTLSTAYSDFLDDLKARDVDSITLCKSDPSNPPLGCFKWNRSGLKFQEHDGASFVDVLLSIAGGGTGSSNASGARTNLGLGTMSTQDNNSVNITGGTLAGSGSGITSLNASNLSSGTVATARLGSGTANSTTFLRGDNSWAVITADIIYGADQSGDFSAAVNTFYNLIGSHIVDLPTVVGNAGKIVGLIMLGTGTWTITTADSATILGAASYSFDWPQYSCIVLKADANGNKWDII